MDFVSFQLLHRAPVVVAVRPYSERAARLCKRVGPPNSPAAMLIPAQAALRLEIAGKPLRARGNIPFLHFL